uniref:ZP domain-containing protein n=1 Tax=Meloidogyne javanica TaxID=6303 RepID=A0A915N413_MELJA
MLPTTEVEARHGIPGCTYSIHRSSIDELDAGKPAGAVIQFARVGDKVLHQWYCSTNEMFGILINNCFVTDGVKQRVQVIDAQGCPLDPILITGTRYSADLQRAYAESQMCMKKDGMCDGITPPNCNGVTKTDRVSSRNGDKYSRRGGTNYDEELHDDNGSHNETLTYQTKPHEQNKSNTSKSNSGTDYEPLEGNQSPPGQEENEDYESSRPEFTTTSLRVPIAKRPTTTQENQSSDFASPPSYPNGAEAPSSEPEAIQLFNPGYSPNTNYGIGRDPPVGLSKTITINNNNPYLPPQPALRSSIHKHHEVVSAEFETEENIPRRKQPTKIEEENIITSSNLPTLISTTSTTTIATTNLPRPNNVVINNMETKKDDVEDYNDSGELNLPPRLTDLLANLQPDQINAQSLQKMFKNSVADRRALLQGVDFIIRKMNQEEEEKREEVEGGNWKRDKRKEKGEDEGEEGRRREENGDIMEENWKEEMREEKEERNMMEELNERKKNEDGLKNKMRKKSIEMKIWREEENENKREEEVEENKDERGRDDELSRMARDSPINKHINSADECALTKNNLTMLGVASASFALILLLITALIFKRFGKVNQKEEKNEKQKSEEDVNSLRYSPKSSSNGFLRRWKNCIDGKIYQRKGDIKREIIE